MFCGSFGCARFGMPRSGRPGTASWRRTTTWGFSPFGAALRHVAGSGRCCSTGRLGRSRSERWLGWLPEQQFRRLHLIAGNTRFLVLPGFRVPNLVSRILGLSARRLPSDMEALRGHPVLLTETFVDPSMFAGTCYRAVGWMEIGETRRFGRDAGGWREHGYPKKVLARPLRRGEGAGRAGRAGVLGLRGGGGTEGGSASQPVRVAALALDSKTASKRAERPNPERVLIAAVVHGSGLTVGQMALAPGKPPSRPSSAFPLWGWSGPARTLIRGYWEALQPAGGAAGNRVPPAEPLSGD